MTQVIFSFLKTYGYPRPQAYFSPPSTSREAFIQLEQRATKFDLLLHSQKLGGAFAWNHSLNGRGPILALGTISTRTLHLISLRQPSTPKKLCAIPQYHEEWIERVVWSHDDNEIFTLSQEATMKIFDVIRHETKQTVDFTAASPTQPPRALCTIPNEPHVLLIGLASNLCLWDRRVGPLTAEHASANSYRGHRGRLADVTASFDGAIFITASFDGTARLWDRRHNQPLVTVVVDPSSRRAVTGVVLDARTNQHLLTNSENGTVHLIDLTKLASATVQVDQLVAMETARQFTGHSNLTHVKRAAFSPGDENLVISGCDTGAAFLWSVHTGAIVSRLQMPAERTGDAAAAVSPVIDAQFAPQCGYPLVAVSTERSLTVWRRDAVTDDAISAAVRYGYGFGEEIEQADAEPVYDVADVDMVDTEEAEDEDDAEDHDMLATLGCTYSRGYTRQRVFVCRTCVDQSERIGEPRTVFGVCRGCAARCHNGHTVDDIGFRPAFRCDCGTTRAHCICAFQAEKAPSNTANTYGHNFEGRYCFCDAPDDGELMVQCTKCAEWFHAACLQIPNDDSVLPNMEFLCQPCVERHYAFLAGARYRVATFDSLRNTPGAVPADVLGVSVKGGIFVQADWRTRLSENDTRSVTATETTTVGSAGNEPVAMATVTATAPPPAPATTAAALSGLLSTLPGSAPRTVANPPLEDSEAFRAEVKRLVMAGQAEKAREMVTQMLLAKVMHHVGEQRRTTVTAPDIAKVVNAAAATRTTTDTTSGITNTTMAEAQVSRQEEEEEEVEEIDVQALKKKEEEHRG